MLSDFKAYVKGFFNVDDTVLIHSDVKGLMRMFYKMGIKISVMDIIDIFLEVVNCGTVLFPTFNFVFCQKKEYSILHTPSLLGILSESARCDQRFRRTKHPMVSFAVCGKMQDEFCDLKNVSGYGLNSPFELMHKSDGKIAVINLEENRSMTFYHYIEEMMNVEYRYNKTFTSIYCDYDGIKSERSYDLCVRDPQKTTTNVNPMGEILWQQNIYRGDKKNTGFGIRVANCQDIFNATSKVILSNEANGVLYNDL